MSAPRASRSAVLLSCGLASVVAFQAALVAGAPWGAAAWGGAQTGQLPAELRVGYALQAAIWSLLTLTVMSRGGIPSPVPHSFSRRAIWLVTSLLAVGAVMNAASSSRWERFGWAPLLLVLAVLSFRLARSPRPEQDPRGHGRNSLGTA